MYNFYIGIHPAMSVEENFITINIMQITYIFSPAHCSPPTHNAVRHPGHRDILVYTDLTTEKHQNNEKTAI